MAYFRPEDFLHPWDRAARRQLDSVPLLADGASKWLETFSERRVRAQLLSSTIRVGPRQMSELYRLLPPICDAFGIDVPEMFLTRGPANAMTVGHTRPVIVIYNELLTDLPRQEIEAVLAHECGHIMMSHILYRQMADVVLRGATGLLPVGLSKLATMLQIPLLNWYRKSELSADRAAAAYLGGSDHMERALFHLIGLPMWHTVEDLDYSEFVGQTQEYDELASGNLMDRWLIKTAESESTHPIPTIRIRELADWAQTAAFKNLVATGQSARTTLPPCCAQCGQRPAPTWRYCQRCGHDLQAPPELED